MFRKILRKKLVLESLYIWRLSSKVTPVLLFSSEFCRFFEDTYLVENLRTVTSDRGYFSRSVWGNSKKYGRSGFLSFDLPSTPLFSLVRFRAPPSNRKVRSSHPLSLNFYTCEVQRKEINNEYEYLWLNSACLLRSHSGIFINWTPLVHGKSVRYMEKSALQRVHLKIRSLQK